MSTKIGSGFGFKRGAGGGTRANCLGGPADIEGMSQRARDTSLPNGEAAGGNSKGVNPSNSHAGGLIALHFGARGGAWRLPSSNLPPDAGHRMAAGAELHGSEPAPKGWASRCKTPASRRLGATSEGRAVVARIASGLWATALVCSQGARGIVAFRRNCRNTATE